MKVTLNSTSEFRGTTQQQWSLVLDDGTKLDFDVESEPHFVDYDGPDVNVTVGDSTLTALELIDLAVASGDVTEDGDEVEVTPDWLAENSR